MDEKEGKKSVVMECSTEKKTVWKTFSFPVNRKKKKEERVIFEWKHRNEKTKIILFLFVIWRVGGKRVRIKIYNNVK